MPRPLTNPAGETPRAIQLAAELAADPALLALRPRRLVQDVLAVRDVGPGTARRAVALARRWVAPQRPLLASDLPDRLP